MKKKIFFWSPLLSHVGTIKAVECSAESLRKYSQFQVYLLNVLGEFDYLKDNKNFIILDVFTTRKFPKTGLLSKITIYFFSFCSLFKLLQYVKKYKPNFILSNLVGFIPICVKFFFSDVKIICSIQGLPKFNFLRNLIWNFFYTKADYIITMTNITKNQIQKKFNFKCPILKIDNPIIRSNIKLLSKENINLDFDKSKKIFCCIGRLTRQKNFIEIINAVSKISQKDRDAFKVLIVGSGEQKSEIELAIKKYEINNVFLLGFKNNPYPYLARSDFFISTSLWEEPGHTIIEAGYLNKLIISSNCPNGPKEILKDGINSIKYHSKDHEKLAFIINSLVKNEIKNIFDLKKNMKKVVQNYTMLRFAKKFNNFIY